uniref:Uncharacterized protein n=1 Tax=Romanomermis culicivorax TaxID=13658 RepID=A0A915KMB4_ROMCU
MYHIRHFSQKLSRQLRRLKIQKCLIFQTNKTTQPDNPMPAAAKTWLFAQKIGMAQNILSVCANWQLAQNFWLVNIP